MLRNNYIPPLPGELKDGDDTRTNVLAVLGLDDLEPLDIGDYNEGYHTPPIATLRIEGKEYSLKSVLRAIGRNVQNGATYYDSLPATGKAGKVYVTADGIFRWTGSAYEPIAAGSGGGGDYVPEWSMGKNLLDDMTAAEIHSRVSAGSFEGIRERDYLQVALTGTFRDYGYYTVPSGTTYYSDATLATSAGTTSGVLYGDYQSATAVKVTISGTAYYVATANCLDYKEVTLNNAIMKFMVGINTYYRHGDSGDIANGKNHLLLCPRDLLPVNLRFRKANDVWEDKTATDPWVGSALYKTLNDPTHGLVKLLENTVLGPYIYAGAAGKGMRYLGGKVGTAGQGAVNGWAWSDRGKIFLPSEREVWGQDIFSNHQHDAGVCLQWPMLRSLALVSKGMGNGGSRTTWWCCSTHSGSSTYVTGVRGHGTPDGYTAGNPWVGCPPCFLFT